MCARACRTRSCEMPLSTAPLLGNRIGQHHVEGRQPVGGDDQQRVGVHGVDVAHLALVDARRGRAARCGKRWALSIGLATIAAHVAWPSRLDDAARRAGPCMKWIGKVVGGAIGAARLGPIGAAARACCSGTSSMRTERARHRPLERTERSHRDRRAVLPRHLPRHGLRRQGRRPRLGERDRRRARRDVRAAPECRPGAGRPSTCFTAGKQAEFRPAPASSRRWQRACRGRARPDAHLSRDPGARRARRQQPRGSRRGSCCGCMAKRLERLGRRAGAHRGGAAHPQRRLPRTRAHPRRRRRGGPAAHGPTVCWRLHARRPATTRS